MAQHSAAGLQDFFANPIAEGADPWVTLHNGEYLWCFSEGNRGIAVWRSDRLTSLGTRHVVWRAPEEGPFSREVWAPEMHRLDERWHIYFAASDGRNENHLAYVLVSSGADPLGPYDLHGPLATGEGADGSSPNVWAIDMTVLEHRRKRYAVWSGWDRPGSDRQFLYLASMESPVELAAPRVRLCSNGDHRWELTGERDGSRGLNEGPQVLKRGARTFIIYSCGASWANSYKLGLLELTGEDPLDPASWTKHPEPVFSSVGEVTGVGHSTFVPSPDGSEWWHAFHAKRDRRHGWRRAVFLQPITFHPDDFPDFGVPVAVGTPMPVPSGQRTPRPTLPIERRFDDGDDLQGFSYFGHQQLLETASDGVHLGKPPAHPVNDYPSGEKLILDGGDFDDIDVSVRIRWPQGGRDAGLLFRTTLPAVGYDAQRGYFAGVLPDEGRVILGKTDGGGWKELGRAAATPEPGSAVTLRVVAIGPDLAVFLDGRHVLSVRDTDHPRGSIGLRVVDTHAQFSELQVTPVQERQR